MDEMVACNVVAWIKTEEVASHLGKFFFAVIGQRFDGFVALTFIALGDKLQGEIRLCRQGRRAPQDFALKYVGVTVQTGIDQTGAQRV